MFISVLIVCIGTILYFFLEKKNSYYQLMAMYLLTISAILLSAFLYTSKTTVYYSPIRFDYKLFSWFSKIKLHIEYISRIYNASIALFMAASLSMLRKITKIRWRWVFLLLTLILAFTVINDFVFSRWLFLAINAAQPGLQKSFWSNIPEWTLVFTESLFFFFLLAPLLALLIQIIKNKIYLNRKYNLFLLTVLLIIHGFIYFILKKIYANIWFSNLDLFRIPTATSANNSYFTAPVLFLLLFVAVAIISLHLKPINSIEVVTASRWLEQNNTLSNSIGMVIHTYKNSFIAIRQQLELVRVYLDRQDYNQIQNHVDISNDIINAQLSSISKNLKNLCASKVPAGRVNLTDCIHAALKNSSDSYDLQIELTDECPVIGDYNALCEVFTNILYNAEYALKDRPDPQIKITLIREGDFCEADIWDNGCGIPKQNLKKIFNPFFSTKPALSFGGLGLSFVKSTIKSHRGDVCIKSMENVYTIVKIVLPLYKNNANQKRWAL